MIGKKISKKDLSGYTDLAIWCNENNATIVDKGEFFEVIKNEEHQFSQAEIQAMLTEAVQEFMDQKAHERNYDDIFTACSYINSSVPKFRAEAEACSKWRDEVWTYCYKALDECLCGARAIPTAEELLAELPKLKW